MDCWKMGGGSVLGVATPRLRQAPRAISGKECRLPRWRTGRTMTIPFEITTTFPNPPGGKHVNPEINPQTKSDPIWTARLCSQAQKCLRLEGTTSKIPCHKSSRSLNAKPQARAGVSDENQPFERTKPNNARANETPKSHQSRESSTRTEGSSRHM